MTRISSRKSCSRFNCSGVLLLLLCPDASGVCASSGEADRLRFAVANEGCGGEEEEVERSERDDIAG